MSSFTGYATPAAGAVVPVHYPGAHISRRAVALAVALSLGIHAAVLLGINPAKRVPLVKPEVDGPVIEVVAFKPEEIDEPLPLPTDDAVKPADITPVLPTRPDTPSVPRPDEFVQPLDLSSLVERPNADATLTAIPPNFVRNGPVKSGEPVFNLGELQRTPVPLSQPPPTYPHSMRREALTATVVVEFIVTTSGSVASALAVNSTHPAFNDAAVAGVSKWKFRAGMRGGRYVNTRMQVPIVFRLNDEG